MKTIICGPPHSGKSVFISNLVKLLPSGHYMRINANGDGEGTWSNNPDQSDVMEARVKGSNSPKDFIRWKRQIDKARLDIVIADIGGRLQDDKIPLFESCDSFVVVSNSAQMIDEWVAFGTSNGCKCLGTVLSEMGDLHEEIYGLEPYVRGCMSGLERGHDLTGSALISAIANAMVVASGFDGYKKKSGADIIDMYDLGTKFGMYRQWKTSTGIDVRNVWYHPASAPALYEYLCSYYTNTVKQCRVYGARSIWASCLVATTVYNNGIHDIGVYGIVSEKYFKISRIAVGTKSAGRLSCSLKEDEEYALLSVTLPHRFRPQDLEKVILPRVDSTKRLLLSGKIPSWLAMSIVLSYDNKEKYVNSPGIGFIQVESIDKEKYGSIINGPATI